MIPDENIDEYLLDLSHDANNLSLFGILHKLVEELQVAVKGITDLPQRLSNTKKLLLHEAIECTEYSEDENICTILQSLIVLDEFIKELISIIFVKNQLITCCKKQLDAI